MELYEQLEYEFATWQGLEPSRMVVCSSGTAALHLALEALELPPGSGVLVPDYTMIACPRAVSMAGLAPILVDCRSDLLLDSTLLDCAPSTTRAVMPVHIYGRQCDMATIYQKAQRMGWWVVEDLAEAHGILPHSSTDAACWSFYKNKIVCGEEGGAVYFKSQDKADIARSLRCLGFPGGVSGQAPEYKHRPRGHNYRLSNLHAKPILQSLRCWGNNNQARREIEGWYEEECPPAWRNGSRGAVWVYDMLIPNLSPTRQHYIVQELNKQNIAARLGFHPVHLQQEYALCRLLCYSSPRSKALGQQVVYLPVQPGMTQGDVRRIMKALQATYNECR